ncbi:MAG: spore coat U domain-containing protein [Desulfuromonadaceae bacterium]|nr:spore coat U domain-containing protein [Desulfuromonadaceae bacterium]
MVKLALLLCTLLFSTECYAFNCSIATTPINFGNYDVFSNQALDSSGTITVDCNNPDQKPIKIDISINSGSSGKFNPRQMQGANGTDRLNYYVFTDPSGAAIWGDGTGGSSIVSTIVTKNSILNSNVYARIPAGQNVSVGTYTDLLTATVSW